MIRASQSESSQRIYNVQVRQSCCGSLLSCDSRLPLLLVTCIRVAPFVRLGAPAASALAAPAPAAPAQRPPPAAPAERHPPVRYPLGLPLPLLRMPLARMPTGPRPLAGPAASAEKTSNTGPFGTLMAALRCQPEPPDLSGALAEPVPRPLVFCAAAFCTAAFCTAGPNRVYTSQRIAANRPAAPQRAANAKALHDQRSVTYTPPV